MGRNDWVYGSDQLTNKRATEKNNIMKRFKPIRIFSVDYGYGWWFGRHFFFFHPFVVIPMYSHHFRCSYEDGKEICAGYASYFKR